MARTVFDPRDAHVGDLVPDSVVGRRTARRIDATAMILPGTSAVDPYIDRIEERRTEFAAWDGNLVVRAPDGPRWHRLLVLDRYGQVYAVHDADDAADLPDADALEEWFRFLATACPECGVLDDPVAAGPRP